MGRPVLRAWKLSRCGLFALLFAAICGCFASVAHAEGTDASESIASLVDRADFEGASALLGSVLGSGKLSQAEAARVHMLAGVIAAARRQPEEAQAAFAKALTLNASVELPASAGPHIIAVFDAARAQVASQPALSLTVELTTGRAPTELLVKAQLIGNHSNLVHHLVLRGPQLNESHPLQEPGLELTRELPEPISCTVYTASAADQFGNELWPDLAHLTVCPPVAPAKTATQVIWKPAPESHEVPLGIWISGGAAAGLTVASAIFGVLALDKRTDYQQKNDDPTVSVADRRDAHDDTLFTQHLATACGAVAVAAAVPVVVYLIGNSKSKEKPHLGVHAGLGQAALVGAF